MPNKEMGLIIKIMGIVGAIFCGISLILPWAGVSLLGVDVNVYTWGVSSYSPLASASAGDWDIFFTTTIDTGLKSGFNEAIVFSIVIIIAFILTLVALIIGILGAKNIGVKPSNSLLTAGILSIVAVVLCVVAVSQANSYYQSLGAVGVAFGYSAGFFLIIVAMILYFVTFALQKLLLSAPAPGMAQQPMYQQPSYQQPQMMYSTQQPPVQQMPPPQTPPPQPPPPQPQTQPPAQTQPPVKTTTSETNAAQKFCPDCGTQLLPNSKFCPSCGKQI